MILIVMVGKKFVTKFCQDIGLTSNREIRRVTRAIISEGNYRRTLIGSHRNAWSADDRLELLFSGCDVAYQNADLATNGVRVAIIAQLVHTPLPYCTPCFSFVGDGSLGAAREGWMENEHIAGR
jgi:hypothetical protein